jgi:transcriptional regulator with XRE-family HTH domain
MPKELDKDLQALGIGKRIRRLRLQRTLTLQNVSDLTGLSKPLLSQIENDMASPPIATLLKISRALGVEIGYFFRTNPAFERISVVRQGEQKEVLQRESGRGARVGYRYESLAYSIPDTHMEPFIVEIEPRAEQELVYYHHPGEEFLYVLGGLLEFRGEGKVIQLAVGDSLYFDSAISHAVRGLRGRKARVIAVIYAPR